MKLRTALAATIALVSVALTAARPAEALQAAAPGGAVFVILPGATATSATVAMAMPNGVPIAIGVLNPTTGLFSPSGLGSETARATAAEVSNGTAISAEKSRAQAAESLAIPQSSLGQPGGPAQLDANGKALLAQIPVTKDATGVESGAIDPIARSAVQPGADLSAFPVTATGVPSGYAASLATIAQQQGVLLDTFKMVGDADDTASLNRACSAGVPILLGPRTYTINNYSCSASRFLLRGIPGLSTVQRTSASGSQAFNISSSLIFIDGVIFDFNKASVTASQWGLFMGAGGQSVYVGHSTLKNNSGTLGGCLQLFGTGPAAGGSFTLEDDEITGCGGSPAYIGSVTNGRIHGLYTHDNSGPGIYIGSYGTASSTNYASNILFDHNRSLRNAGTGAQIGGLGAPYVYGTPQAINVTSEANLYQDNAPYQLTLQADHSRSIGDQFPQGSATVFGAIDCNARYVQIDSADINLTGASYGVDCGGAIEATVRNSNISMNSGTLLDLGGTQNSTGEQNKLYASGTAYAAVIYAIETDGSGVPFPTLQTNLTLQNNDVFLYGSSAKGFNLIDDPGGASGVGPTKIVSNHFYGSNGAGSSYDITYIGSSASVVFANNDHNGVHWEYINPNGNGDIIFDEVYDEVRTYSNTTNIRSVLNVFASNFGSGGSILYVEPTAGGSGYTSATTLSASGGSGSGWTGTPMISQGVIIGVRTKTSGSGYSGTITVTASDSGGGSGATFSVGNVGRVSQSKKMTVYSGGGQLLQSSGGYLGLLPATPILIGPATQILLEAGLGGTSWTVNGFTPGAYASSALPTCNATSSGAQTIVTGSASGKWQARCNGTNWIYPDGTTAP